MIIIHVEMINPSFAMPKILIVKSIGEVIHSDFCFFVTTVATTRAIFFIIFTFNAKVTRLLSYHLKAVITTVSTYTVSSDYKLRQQSELIHLNDVLTWDYPLNHWLRCSSEDFQVLSKLLYQRMNKLSQSLKALNSEARIIQLNLHTHIAAKRNF